MADEALNGISDCQGAFEVTIGGNKISGNVAIENCEQQVALISVTEPRENKNAIANEKKGTMVLELNINLHNLEKKAAKLISDSVTNKVPIDEWKISGFKKLDNEVYVAWELSGKKGYLIAEGDQAVCYAYQLTWPEIAQYVRTNKGEGGQEPGNSANPAISNMRYYSYQETSGS